MKTDLLPDSFNINFPLFRAPISEMLDERELETLDGRFKAFDQANPHIYTALKDLALHASRRDAHVSIACLFEVLRYLYELGNEGELRLNNDYRALYARKLMARVPELRGYFRTRKRTAVAEEPAGWTGIVLVQAAEQGRITFGS